MADRSVDDIKPGDELAADVLTPQGVLLFREGTILTESQVDTLKKWKVRKVDIVGPERIKLFPLAVGPTEEDEKTKEMAAKEAKDLFIFNDPSNELIQNTYTIVTKNIIKKLAGNKP